MKPNALAPIEVEIPLFRGFHISEQLVPFGTKCW